MRTTEVVAESCRPGGDRGVTRERAGEQVGDGLASKALLDLERRADLANSRATPVTATSTRARSIGPRSFSADSSR